MKFILKLVLAGSIAAAVIAWPAQLQAQNTNKPAPAKKTSADAKETGSEKKPSAGPFHGKLAAVDKVAKTISVGKRTFQVTSESKIKKDGKPATLADGVVGEEVSGYVKPNPEGKLVATTINFGPKTAKGTEKKAAAEKDQK